MSPTPPHLAPRRASDRIRMGSCSTTVATTAEKGSAVGLFGAERDGGYQLCPAPGRTEDVQVTGKRLDTVPETN